MCQSAQRSHLAVLIAKCLPTAFLALLSATAAADSPPVQTIPFSGYSAAFAGIVAWDNISAAPEPVHSGHALPAPYNATFSNAYYYLATHDYILPAGGDGCQFTAPFTGFPQLTTVMAQLAGDGLFPHDLSVRLGLLGLGQDVQGQDWTLGDDIETRCYSADGFNSTLRVCLKGETVLTAPAPDNTVAIDYQTGKITSESAVTLLQRPAGALSAAGGQLADAILADLGGKGVRVFFTNVTAGFMPLAAGRTGTCYDVQGRLEAAALPGMLTLTTPNGGETWLEGSTQTIRWSYTGAVNEVFIDLVDAASAVRIGHCTAGTNGGGIFSWSIPVDALAPGAYRIRVSADAAGSTSDASDNPLTLAAIAKTVTVATPNGGERWYPGRWQTVRWSFTGTPGGNCAKVEIYRGALLVATLAQGLPLRDTADGQDGSYSFRVPADWARGSDYTVKVTRTDVAACSDSSDLPFTVGAGFFITNPTAAVRGRPCQVTISALGNAGLRAKVELIAAGGTKALLSSSIPIALRQVHNWRVPATAAVGSRYRLRVTSLQANGTVDESPLFSIYAPLQIALAEPNNRTLQYQAGSMQTLRWTCTGGRPNEKVKMLLWNGSRLQATVADNVTPGAGTLAWPMLPAYPLGTGYKIQIVSTLDATSTVTGLPFSILAPPTLTVTEPAAQTRWEPGDSVAIGWTYAGAVGNRVTIDLLNDNTKVATLAGGTSIGLRGSGGFRWTVPANVPATDRGKLRLTSNSTPPTVVTGPVFTIASPSTVTVTAPATGERLARGHACTIRWATTGVPGPTAKIELLNGTRVTLINAAVPMGVGSYEWQVPPTLAPGAAYRLRVSSLLHPACTGTSAPFVVFIPTEIRLLTPEAGVAWHRNTVPEIRWTYSGTPGDKVKLELFSDKAAPVLIAQNLGIGRSGNGKYAWRVPVALALGDGYTIKATCSSTVVGVPGPVISDTSAGFSIADANTIRVTSPAVGERWEYGQVRSIRWTYVGTPGPRVRVELLKGDTVVATPSASAPIGVSLLGSLNWTVPATLVPGPDYRVRITSTTLGEISGTSQPFAIGAVTALTLVEPNDGGYLDRGRPQVIRWTYSGSPGAYVQLELLQGTRATVICEQTAIGANGVGEYAWALPADQAEGSNYRVRITATQQMGPGTTDTSARTFTIQEPWGLTLTAPVAGEVTANGYAFTVRWRWAGELGNLVDLYLYRGSDWLHGIPIAGAPNCPIGPNGEGSYSFALPDDVPLGNDYHLRIVSDLRDGFFDDSDAFTVANPMADLVIDEVTVPESWNTEQAGEITFRVTNRGYAPAAFPSYSDAWLLDVGGNVLATQRANGLVIAAGQSETCTATLPANSTPEGTHHVKIMADPLASVAESRDDNNANEFDIIMTPGPARDLAITSLAVSPAQPTTQSHIQILVTVKNQGTAPVLFELRDLAIRVDRGGPLGQAFSRATMDLAPGESTVVPAEVADTVYTVGAHHLTVTVDAGNVLHETDESNNHAEIDITVGEPGPLVGPAPDLTVENLTLPAEILASRRDKSSYLQLMIVNHGDAAAAVPGDAIHTRTTWTGPTVGSIDRQSGLGEVVELAPGASWPTSTSVRECDLRPGLYTCTITVDPNNRIQESNEDNNTLTFSFYALGDATLPDLVITDVVFDPPSPRVGQPFHATATAKNQGVTSAHFPGERWGARVLDMYGSGGSDHYTLARDEDLTIPPDESRVFTLYSSGVDSAGPAVLHFEVDPDGPYGTVWEANEVNNTKTVTLTIEPAE